MKRALWALVFSLVSGVGNAADVFRLVDMGLPPGATWSRAIGLNRSGMVFGKGGTAGATFYWLWTKGGGYKTFTLGDRWIDSVAGPNDFGDICGNYVVGGSFARWSDGTVQDLAVSGYTCFSRCINDNRQILGSYANNGSYCGYWTQDGVFHVLPSDNLLNASPWDMNNAGQVCGDGGYVGYLYDPTLGTRILAYPGFSVNKAFVLNSWGAVAGSGFDPAANATEMWMWTPNTGYERVVNRLANFGGDARPTGLNSYNALVGDYSGRGAFYYRGDRCRRLNRQIILSANDWVFDSAVGINDNFQIAGTATKAGVQRPYLLEPLNLGVLGR